MSKKTQKHLSRSLSLDDCKFWEQNKRKNPITKFTLSENSKILKEIASICEPMLEKINKKNNVHKQDSNSSADILINTVVPTKRKQQIIASRENHYPDLDDENFAEKISQLYEYYIYRVPEYDKIKNKQDYYDKSNELCGDFEKTLYQYFVSNYISTRTPYKSVLLYHGVGVGKTCSAITLAETFLKSHSIYEEPKIWVIMPQSLKHSFKEQIFSLMNHENNFDDLMNQCTGDLYIKLSSLMRDTDKEKAKQNVKKLIKSRYRLFTYEMFASFIQTEYIDKNRVVSDKVIIVDEAHNIRSSDNLSKKVYSALVNVAETGHNNRMVLLSATPMYDKAEDILYLFYLLVKNDKRTGLLDMPFPVLFNNNKITKSGEALIKKLSGNYVSYLRGKNPFTFALKLSPKTYFKNKQIEYLTNECKLDSNGNEIPDKFKGWVTNLEDSVVTSQLGVVQKEYLGNTSVPNNDHNVFTNTQPMNIVYDTDIGERGFNTFFTRTGENNNINVKYNNKYIDALYPDADHLGKFSGKMLNICNIIKNTDGIIVIYSRYIWSGIIPMAVCLEHIGYQREGVGNILKNPRKINDPPTYGQNTAPRYCILSSDNNEVMGNSSIDNLVKKINSDENSDGSRIKVILMTPVASEGLSFYNVREMHIMEPWFHFNRAKQVIGRGIRNCRHQALPLEKRNVSIFMHASYISKEIESHDIHALRISSVKMLETDTIDKIIRDNAIDCFLMKNINYFPINMFELGKMKITTSQNITIDYELGDEQSLKPMCKSVTPTKFVGMRHESYGHFIFLIKNRIRRMILKCIQSDTWFITVARIVEAMKFDKEIVYAALKECIFPKTLIEGYILALHNNGIHIMQIKNTEQKYIKLIQNSIEDVKKDKKTLKCFQKEIRMIEKKPLDDAIVSLYLSLDKDCFIQLAKDIVENKIIGEQSDFIAKCLSKQGVLISNKEINTSTNNPYIGYVNIYNDKFEPIMFSDGKYRDFTDKETNELISNRIKRMDMPDMTNETMPWGIIMPPAKGKTKNLFKIFTPGKGNGIKTGRECSSMDKATHDELLKQLKNNKTGTKVENCKNILMSLIHHKRMTINPEYVPR